MLRFNKRATLPRSREKADVAVVGKDEPVLPPEDPFEKIDKMSFSCER